jgi:hypothetical protein
LQAEYSCVPPIAFEKPSFSSPSEPALRSACSDEAIVSLAAARGLDEAAAPARFEFFAPDELRPPGPQVLDDRLVVVDVVQN